MAYTKIIVIHDRLDRCLTYVENPEKTSLAVELDYALNLGKTETTYYQDAIGCRLDHAYPDMIDTKRRWGKLEGHVLGYHLIQSFSPGEVTPELAHKIGMEFCQRYLAPRYEVVITTHLNKEHLHNHIVFNSVSYLDGRMYRNNFTDYFRDIRGTSDQLCRENNLSIIEPSGRGKPYIEWMDHNEGKPTIRGMVKADVDGAIQEARDFQDFLHLLRLKDYAVKYGPHVKYTAIRPPGGERYIRLKSLGEPYTDDNIRKAISERPTSPRAHPVTSRQNVAKSYRCTHYHKARKLSGFRALYFKYLYLLGKVGRSQVRPASTALRGEVTKLNRYIRQAQFIREHRINTKEELQKTISVLQDDIKKKEDERKSLYKEKRYSGETPEMEANIQALTGELRTLRWQLSICESIQDDSEKIRATVEQTTIVKQKEEKSHEHWR